MCPKEEVCRHWHLTEVRILSHFDVLVSDPWRKAVSSSVRCSASANTFPTIKAKEKGPCLASMACVFSTIARTRPLGGPSSKLIHVSRRQLIRTLFPAPTCLIAYKYLRFEFLSGVSVRKR